MNWQDTKPIELSLSTDQIKDILRERLYALGYGKRSTQNIAEISFGALHEQEVPVHFWIEDEEPVREQEVTVLIHNGKST